MKMGQQFKGQAARGINRGAYRQFVIRIDHETADQVVDLANTNGTSTAEQIRTLIEWGLEALE